MINQKQYWAQYFAYFNFISLVSNILILFIYETASPYDDSYAQLITGFLIAVKMVQAQIIPQLIAYFRNPQYQSNKAFLDLVKPDSEISESDVK